MGGNGRVVVTAITAALGGNVSGSTADLVQNAAIGFIQGKGAHAIKDYVDKYHGGDDSIRAALQGVLGCAGAAATGGDCSSAAVGAAGSVLINKILGGTTVKDPVTGKDREMTLEEKQDRENLVNSILTGTVAALGGDAAAANAAAKIEMENNHLSPAKNGYYWVLNSNYNKNCQGGNAGNDSCQKMKKELDELVALSGSIKKIEIVEDNFGDGFGAPATSKIEHQPGDIVSGCLISPNQVCVVTD